MIGFRLIHKMDKFTVLNEYIQIHPILSRTLWPKSFQNYNEFAKVKQLMYSYNILINERKENNAIIKLRPRRTTRYFCLLPWNGFSTVPTHPKVLQFLPRQSNKLKFVFRKYCVEQTGHEMKFKKKMNSRTYFWTRGLFLSNQYGKIFFD